MALDLLAALQALLPLLSAHPALLASTLTLVLPTIAFITWWYVHRQQNGLTHALKQLPGQPALPWLGAVLKFNPLQMHHWMFEQNRHVYGDCTNWYYVLAGMTLIVISDVADIEYVLENSHKLFKKSPVYQQTIGWWANDTVLLNTGSRWQQQRRLINPAFNYQRLKQQVGVVQEVAQQLVERINREQQEQRSVVHDMYFLLSSAALDVLGMTGFGFRFNTVNGVNKYYNGVQAVMKDSYARLFRLSNRVQGLWMQYVARKGLAVVDSAVKEMLQQRRQQSPAEVEQQNDVLSRMIVAQRDGLVQLSELDYMKQMRLLCVAGSDTTSAWMCSTLVYLATHADVQRKLQAEVDELYTTMKNATAVGQQQALPDAELLTKLPYLQAVMRESLRLRTSIPIIDRQLADDVKELTLPSGLKMHPAMNVTVNLYALHRNRTLWGPDVDEFKPSRWLTDDGELLPMSAAVKRSDGSPSSVTYQQAYKAFSMGAQSCPGALLATLEASILVAHLLHHYTVQWSDDVRHQKPAFDYAISMIYPQGLHLQMLSRQADAVSATE